MHKGPTGRLEDCVNRAALRFAALNDLNARASAAATTLRVAIVRTTGAIALLLLKAGVADETAEGAIGGGGAHCANEVGNVASTWLLQRRLSYGQELSTASIQPRDLRFQ